MIALLRILSTSYVRRHPVRMLLAVAAIAAGVATFVSIGTAQRALASSVTTSVGRLAGHANLQITAVGGVPEALQERLRTVAGIKAAQPIIEQVVQPDATGLGGLLIIGVDLVGDQEIRDYPVAEGVDVEDPLEFLAQPDSIALGATFAARAHLATDDVLRVRVGGTTRELTVRALLPSRDFARAFGGNVAVMDVFAAQDLFGRGRRFDRIEVRLEDNVAVDEGAAAILRALGPGYHVETPERRGADLQRLADSVVGALDVITAMALSVGVFLVFNVFRIATDRRRRDIGILRTLGTTPGQVATLFLTEAGVLGLLGGLAGVAVGNALASWTFAALGAVLQATRGMTDQVSLLFSPTVTVQGVILGIVASIVGAWVPAREASRVPPVDAIATGVFAVSDERTSAWHALAGLGLIAGAYLLGHFNLLPRAYLLPVVTLVGAFGAIVFTGRAALTLIAPLAPVLRRVASAPGRVAADALLQHRRTRGTAAALTIAAAFVLGTAGFLQAVRASFDGWIANVATADVVVRASTGWGPSSMRLGDELRHTILETPGVRALDAMRSDRIDVAGDSVTLTSVESRDFFQRVHPTVVSGNGPTAVHDLEHGDACLVSTVFAERHHLGPGAIVTLDSPTGPVRLTVAAVATGDSSTITIDRRVFADRWASDRVDAFYVRLAPGADAEGVRAALQTRLADDTPALISTRDEFVAEMREMVGLVYAMIRGTVFIALIAALLSIALSQLVVVAERSRDIGVLRAIGAVPTQIGAAVVMESTTLAMVSLALALPLGDLLSWLLRAQVSESLTGFHFTRAFPMTTALTLVVGLPIIGAVAMWAPARWATAMRVTETITYD